ncbi:MAG: YggT family protein [Thermoleophilia bacterium]|nr:YggT family protein [Thermoleophilia bacterium]
MSPEPRDDKSEYVSDEYGETEVVEDKAGQRENEIGRINGIVWLLLGIVEVIIGMRVVLKLLAANPDNAFASFIYRVARVFVWPFFGLVAEPTSNGSVFEVGSIIAMAVYLLIAWGITRLIYLVMMPSRVRHVRTVNKH